MIEVFFLNLKSARRLDKIEAGNHQLMEKLVSSFISFRDLKPIKHGRWYVLEIEDGMKEWGMNKLREMGLVNDFEAREVKRCSCPCHRGANILEDPGCCRFYGFVRQW